MKAQLDQQRKAVDQLIQNTKWGLCLPLPVPRAMMAENDRMMLNILMESAIAQCSTTRACKNAAAEVSSVFHIWAEQALILRCTSLGSQILWCWTCPLLSYLIELKLDFGLYAYLLST